MGHRRGPAADSRRRWAPYLIVVLISTFVVSRWFQAGTFVSTGDMGPFIRRGWAPELAWSWNHSVTGAGSAAYNVARAFELGGYRRRSRREGASFQREPGFIRDTRDDDVGSRGAGSGEPAIF